MSVQYLLGRISAVIINPLIFLAFSVALLYFVFGVVKFIAKAGDDKAREMEKILLCGELRVCSL